jgi:2-methylcitrate dehydratase PrpD
MEITDTVARYVHDTRFEDLPEHVIERAKYAVLDNVGCVLGGYQTDVGKLNVELAKDLGGKPESMLFGDGSRVTSVNAAYANATLARILDFDEHYPYAPSMVATPTVQAALALGEARKVSGAELLTAVVVGYEVATRVGRATGADRTADVPHVQINLGFGAVAAACKVLNLSQEQIVHALGILGNRMRGNPMRRKAPGGVQRRSEHRATVKSDRAFNAPSGVLAALQAEKGLTGPLGVLDGKEFWQAGGADTCYYDELTLGLGELYRIMETEFKPWPSCRTCHTPVTAVMDVLEDWPVDPDQIEEIRLWTFMKMVGYDWGTDPIEASFVCPCAVALAVASGEPPGPRWYTTGRFTDPDIRALARKVIYEFDVEAEELADMGKRICTARITTKDGRSRTARSEWAKGRPENPMSGAELKAKFRANADSVLTETQIDEVLASFDGWQVLEDVSSLIALLRGT